MMFFARRAPAPAPRATVDELERRCLLSAYVAVNGINDVVYDAARDLVYATTARGTVERYDAAAGRLLAPWTVGGNLLGADITPDGSFLYVADGNNPQIRKVNLSDGTSVPLTYSPAFGESNAYDVAVVGPRAVFTTQYAGSGWTPLREIDLASGAITTRTDIRDVRQNSILSRAGDRSGMFLTESNISSGPIRYYDTGENRFTAYGETQTFHGGTLHDVNSDGRLVALRMGSGVALYTDRLVGVGTIPGLDGGLKFDAAGDMLYAVNSATDQLVGYDTAARVQRYTVPLDRNLSAGSQYGSGMMAVGADKAFVSDDAGLLVIDLPQPTGHAARFQVEGYYTYTRRGTAGTIRVRALDPAGLPATNYRGTIRVTSSDPAATLPPDRTFTADDAGYVELPITLNTAGTQTITVTDTADGRLGGQITNLRVHAGGVGVIPVGDRREHVFDARRNQLFISTARGAVERYDLSTESLLDPLPVGVSLMGIDVSADGRWLLVQESASTGTGGEYIKIDLDRLDRPGAPPAPADYVTRIRYDNYSLESGGWDIARTARGTFLADGQFAGSGWVPVREIDPVADTATAVGAVGPFGNVRQNTGIGRSPDGRYQVFTESNISSGPITVYDTLDRRRVATVDTGTFLSGESSAVNRDGTLFGVRLNGTRIFNRSLQVVTTLTGVDGGAAFDPVADVFYGVNSAADRLDVYRTSDWSVVNSAPLGENVPASGAMGNGVTTVAVNGGVVFVSTPNGVRAVPLRTRAVPGNYTVAEGGSVALTGGAVAGPGRTIVSYEWDFDYDGTTFTRDAAGATATFSAAGLDGPSTRQVALRATDSAGGTDVAAAVVGVTDAPPVLTVSAPATIGVGGTLTLGLSAADPGRDTVTSWTVDWGEGPAQTVAAGAGGAASVSRALSVEGPHTVRVTATDEDGTYSAAPVEVLVSTPPTVASVVYDVDAPAVRVRFSEPVGPSIDRTDFELVQRSSGLAVPTSKTAVSYDAASRTATITFPGFARGVIPDGNYDVTVSAAGVRDGIGNALDGDRNGAAGDDAVARVFVLAGDANRDGRVNLADFGILRANFGRRDATFSLADFNYDGTVTLADFGILRGNFGKSLLG